MVTFDACSCPGWSGVVVDSPPLPRDDRIELEIRGYVKPNELVARYIQVFPFRE
jgi:hypothetical protein